MPFIKSSRIMRSTELNEAQKSAHLHLVDVLNGSPSPAMALANYVREQQQHPELLAAVCDVHVRALSNRSAVEGNREAFTQLMEAIAPTPLMACAPSSATQRATEWLVGRTAFTPDNEEANSHIARLGRLACALTPNRTHNNAVKAALRQRAGLVVALAPTRMFSLLSAVQPYSDLNVELTNIQNRHRPANTAPLEKQQLA